MAFTKRIVCLANSYKNRGLCIAGREVTPSGYGPWIRPISARPKQELYLVECHCPGVGVPNLLDIVDITFHSAAPNHHQIENHLIDPHGTWIKRGELPFAELEHIRQQPPTLWINTGRTAHGINDCIARAEALTQRNSLPHRSQKPHRRGPRRPLHPTQAVSLQIPPRRDRLQSKPDRPSHPRPLRAQPTRRVLDRRQPSALPHPVAHRTFHRRRSLPQTRCRHPPQPLIRRPRMTPEVFTIGHSNHTAEDFLRLLATHRITAIADVRSRPYSRYNPQFDREALTSTLKQSGIHYVFLGNELGARSPDPTCYLKGQVQFDRLAQTKPFQEGLDRIRTGAATHRIALMCAEKEPLDCHRTILVSRELAKLNIPVRHILPDATLEDHADTVKRLAATLGLRDDIGHMFRTPEDLLEDAYRLQEKRIAYQDHAPEAPAA